MNQRDKQTSRQTPLAVLAGYGLAVASTALAALVRWLLLGALAPTPYLGFYPAVVVAAALGGVGPGLVATFGSMLLVNFVFGQFNIHDNGSIMRLVIWIIAGIAVSLLAGMQRAARRRENQRAEELRRLNDELEIRVKERTAEILQANRQLRSANEKLADLNRDKSARHMEELQEKNHDLSRLNRAMVGRELRMIELKQEVNNLCTQVDQPPRYVPDSGEI